MHNPCLNFITHEKYDYKRLVIRPQDIYSRQRTVDGELQLNTHDSLNILEFFQQPAFIPASIRLKPSLVRKDIFTECTEDYQELVDRFKKLNEDYMIPAKEIMYEDKILVHRQAQNESRNVIFRSILSITKATAACSVPNRVHHTLMSLNHPITGPVNAKNNDDGERALIAGFAYLQLITDKIPEIKQYTGTRMPSNKQRTTY